MTGRLLMSAVALFVAAFSAMPGFAWAQAVQDNPSFALPEVPAPPSGPSVTLAEAVRRADGSNRSLEALRVDIKLAAAKLQSSWAGLLPTLYGTVGYTLSQGVAVLAEDQSEVDGPGDTSRLTAGISLQAPLIQARQWVLIDAAKTGSAVTELQVEQARQILLYSVAEAYYQAATAVTLIAVYRAQYDALREHLDVAQARMDAGVGNVMDVRAAQTDLVSSWVEIVKAGYALADAREALAILMGMDGELPMPVADAAPAQPGTTISADLLSAMGGADHAGGADAGGSPDDRWDLKVLNRQVDAMNAELKAGKMAFVPTLGFSFNYGADILAAATGTSDPNQWSLGLTLNIPIFDYAFFPALDEGRAQITQAQLQAEQLRLEGAAAIAKAGRNVNKLSQMMAAQKVKAVLADDLLSLAEADFANGTGLAIAVTDARRTALAAHVDLATATWEYELGLLSLNREMGVDIMKALEGR